MDHRTETRRTRIRILIMHERADYRFAAEAIRDGARAADVRDSLMTDFGLRKSQANDVIRRVRALREQQKRNQDKDRARDLAEWDAARREMGLR